MQIDPLQPIMFDSETIPGMGAGYWQADPFGGSSGRARSRPARNRTERIIQGATVAAIVAFIAVGWLAPLL